MKSISKKEFIADLCWNILALRFWMSWVNIRALLNCSGSQSASLMLNGIFPIWMRP